MKRFWLPLIFILLLSLLLAACTNSAQAPLAAEQTSSHEGSETEALSSPAPAGVKPVHTWFQYDQNNTDPASDERVGNRYLREAISQFNDEFKGKWEWVNQPKAYDKMSAELVAAVQAGGDVPDIFELVSLQSMIDFYRHGTAQDLRPWAQQQSWWQDLDPSAVSACTGPDGALYCIPMAELPQVVYVWKDRFPEGYPKTPESFMAKAEELKGQGLYAITFFGSTDKGGGGLTRAIWTTIASFGGSLDDGQGAMLLNTPENIAAIQFLRDIVARGYVPEIAFAGGFREEDAFKDASAGSFPTGLFGYRYVNPLTAPSGKKYDKGNAEDMLDAVDAGDVYLSPFLSANGHKPGCGIGVEGFVIPVGAKNIEGAHDYINWMMQPQQNVPYVLGPGGGFPALGASRKHEAFQTAFYKEAADAVSASACRPWYGSLQRPAEAQELVMSAIYKLIKEDPTADIGEMLTKTQEEYNANN